MAATEMQKVNGMIESFRSALRAPYRKDGRG